MSTVLSFLSGRQITNSNGIPQAGALLYHYQAGTTTNLTVYSNQAGTTAHAQPVVCDSGGFAPIVYIGEASDWKVIIKTALSVTLQTYDNLPKSPAAASATSFAAPLLTWNQKTSASSPVSLTSANAGNAYEADTTSGSITFNLPSAASVGNGKGFVFKKTASANSLILDPNGSETIDDVSTSLTITTKDLAIGIFSNGAEWYRALDVVPYTQTTIQRFTSGSGATYTPAIGIRHIRVRMVGGGGGGGAVTTNDGVNGGDSAFATWTAVKGNGGPHGNAAATAGGAGGTGGTNGTGTLIHRADGMAGQGSDASGPVRTGPGGISFFGGAGSGQNVANAAGLAAKANSGSGGSGGLATAAGEGSGGGAGEYVEFYMSAAQVGASQTYTVGAGGAGGAAGNQAGGAGAAGVIIIEEFYY